MADLLPQGDGSAASTQQPPPPDASGAQALDQVAPQGPRAVGTQADGNNAIQQIDPTAPQQPTADEQAQYDQFVSRFMLIVSDTSQAPPQNGQPGTSMNQTVLNELNDPHVPLPVAIGKTAANIAMMIVHLAKVQNITYDPSVLFHATFECVAVLYLTGSAAGIFKGVPPFKGMEDAGHYNFDHDEMTILVGAQAQAVRFFGNMGMKAGLFSADIQKGNLQFWQEQIQREVQTGQVKADVLQKVQDMLPNGGQPSPGASGTPGQSPQSPPQPAPAPAQPPMNNAGGLMPQPPLPNEGGVP